MQTEQERRTLLAVGLCMAVYLVWMQFFVPPMDTAQQITSVDDIETPAAQAQIQTDGLAGDVPTAPGQTVDEDSVAAQDTAPEVVTPKFEKIAAHRVEHETDAIQGMVHSDEGAFHSVTLKNYTDQATVNPLWSWLFDGAEGDWVRYTGGDDPEPLLTAQGGFLLAGAGDLGGDVNHRISRDGDAIQAKGLHTNGLSVTKRYTPGNDGRTLDVTVEYANNGSASIRDLWIGVADVPDGEDADRFANVTRPIALIAEDLERVDDLSDLDGPEYERFDGKVDWFGMGNKYFMSVLLPLDDVSGEWVVDRIPDGRIGSFMRLTQPLDAGAKREVRFRAYMGPKDLDKTVGVGNNLDRAVEFGWFGMFAKMLLWMLKFFHGLVGNWGVAILLLTCSVKILFFPLMQKQFVSSKRMQAIQPQLKALKEKYKDNQQLQTQETMRLFQENKVNPMSGCLPMIIQMPVWFALYNVMLYSVELYGTSFLYLKDLTEVDPTGFLPLAVTVLMVLQQKLMPLGSMDPMQQKMMRIMPLGFGLFMFTFPAGLVLYFSVNNLLTILQQWLIYRKKDDETGSTSKGA